MQNAIKTITFFFVFITNICFCQNTISKRFKLPKGFERQQNEIKSFENYLQNLPLKDNNAQVKYFNGALKPNNAYLAVVDLPIGSKDLHQCADAVMRLRADYFYTNKKFDKIHFNFTNGFRIDFSKWIQGYRIGLKGSKTYWKKTAVPSSDSASYWKYLEQVFQYAGTASLEKELISVEVKTLKIGDVFIKGGFPGHAVIVVDVAENKTTNKKIFMLAQSYMPAQELQILKNITNKAISPWYESDFNAELITPEWTFSNLQLKRFKD